MLEFQDPQITINLSPKQLCQFSWIHAIFKETQRKQNPYHQNPQPQMEKQHKSQNIFVVIFYQTTKNKTQTGIAQNFTTFDLSKNFSTTIRVSSKDQT